MFAFDVSHGSINHQHDAAGEDSKEHTGKRSRECTRIPRQFPLPIESDNDRADGCCNQDGCGHKDGLELVVAPPDVDTCHGIGDDVVGSLTRRYGLLWLGFAAA